MQSSSSLGRRRKTRGTPPWRMFAALVSLGALAAAAVGGCAVGDDDGESFDPPAGPAPTADAGGAADAGRCPPGQTRCDGLCVDTRVDRAHCGACGTTCDEGHVCATGACTRSCPPGQSVCGAACVDLSTSSDHCGACGEACGPNEVCSADGCVARGGGGDGRPKVAIVGSATGSLDDVKNKLIPFGAFSSVDAINVSAPKPTPTLATLAGYDAVAFFTYLELTNPTALGDVLAAYLEGGGGVVAFSIGASQLGIGDAQTSSTLRGEYADKYALLPRAMPSKLDVVLGEVLEPASPLLAGVSKLDCVKPNAFTFCEHLSGAPIHGGVVVARWSDGSPLVLRRDFNGSRVVELNFFAGSSSASGAWDPASDGAVLIKNALSYVATKGAAPPP